MKLGEGPLELCSSNVDVEDASVSSKEKDCTGLSEAIEMGCKLGDGVTLPPLCGPPPAGSGVPAGLALTGE